MDDCQVIFPSLLNKWTGPKFKCEYCGNKEVHNHGGDFCWVWFSGHRFFNFCCDNCRILADGGRDA